MTTEGRVEVMTTEGGVEDQFEWEAARQGRERREGSARTFIGPAARGRGPPRNSVSSPESGALIGPDPLRSPAVMAGNRSILLPARLPQAIKMSCSNLTT